MEPSARLREVAEQYAQALRGALGERLVSVVLFGSVARGEAKATSDVDLLVVVDGLPRSRLARQEVLREADARVAPQLDALRAAGVWADVRPILKTPEEAAQPSPLYFDLVEDAVLLYDRGEFFAHVLERMRQSLRRLGARRLRLGEARYWDLKPDFRPGDVFEI